MSCATDSNPYRVGHHHQIAILLYQEHIIKVVAIWFTCEDLDAAAELAGVTTGSSWALTLVGSIQVFALAEAHIAYARNLTFVDICYKSEQPNEQKNHLQSRNIHPTNGQIDKQLIKWAYAIMQCMSRSRSTDQGIHH